MITVVFDTNIFISAFEFGGVPRDAFLLASAGLFDVRTMIYSWSVINFVRSL